MSAVEATAAVTDWLDRCIATHRRCYAPAGRYRVAAPVILDLTKNDIASIEIYGDGMQQSVFDVVAPPGEMAGPAPAVAIRCGDRHCDYYYLHLHDLGIMTHNAGISLQVAKPDFSDALNSADFRNVWVGNDNPDEHVVVCQLNYVLSSVFENLLCNGHGAGVALQIRQVEFTSFVAGSFSNAGTGLHITGGISFGNLFTTPDFENVVDAVRQDSRGAQGNTVIGGQFSWSGHAIVSSASGTGGLRFISPNFQSSGFYRGTVLDPEHYAGVVVTGNFGLGVTPPVPPSGMPLANKTGQQQIVTVWGGEVSLVRLNDFDLRVGSGSFPLRPGQSIAIFYSRPPSWLWSPLAN